MESGSVRELILPLAVVTIIGMMVVPLPAVALDVLLAANISFSLLLLFAALYTRDPERFTVLPSLLLLTTLFRLGLNVSTTRQLLTHGEAPQVVAAFGEFVVGGNVLAGCVVFLIVTLVQFIVVSKGAERVAEVAARFTLDAMPGKQIAIDADIRAGILSIAEARERRRELQRESKLFGALDGAMKFIKGDAIAGLCIAVLNIGAGFCAGVFQLGLSMKESLDRFTIFTIGDSLVSQVPALLVAVAAGIAVTRVGESEGSTLASELVSQIAGEPRALIGTAGLLAAMAFSPGLPTGIFLGLAGAGWLLAARRKRDAAVGRGKEDGQSFAPRALPEVLLCFSPEAREIMLAGGLLPRSITEARKELFQNLGILLPEPEWIVVPERAEAWIGIEIEGVPAGSCLIDRRLGADAAAAVVRDLFIGTCRERIEELVDDTQIRMLLEVHSSAAEDLINGMIPKQVSVTTLTRLVRDLVGEGVSVRSLRTVLQGIAEHCLVEGPLEYPLAERRYLSLLAGVRVHLRRQIIAGLEKRNGKLSAWELSPEVDRLLDRAVTAACPIAPELAGAIAEAVKELPWSDRPIILCSPVSRKLVSHIARSASKAAVVLSPEELADEHEVTIVGELAAPSRAGPEEAPPVG